MKYESILKQNYKYPGKIEEIYANKFHDTDTIHIDFTIQSWPTFLCQPPELLYLIIKIQRADIKIRELRRNLPGVAINQFTNRCLIDEIVLTNDIEGVNSTRREISEVLDKLHEKHADRRFRGLVMKYLMLDTRDEIALDTCQDVRNIYDDLVLKEVVAEDAEDAPDGVIFRKGPVSVKSSTQKEIHRGLMPEAAIQQAMQNVLLFLQRDEVDPLLRIAAAHYLMGYIHPFYNGNGRLARFISSYLLSRELDPLVGYRLSYTIKENISKYYEGFKVCNDPRNRGDITPFAIVFLEIVLQSMDQLQQALQRRQVDLKRYREKIRSDPMYSTKDLYEIADYLIQASLFAEEGISTQTLLSCTLLSHATLRKRLKKIQDRGALIVTKKGKEKYYKLDLTTLDLAEIG
jgi:Fic family protein